MSESVWRTWKPYAVIVAVGIGGIWWINSQSSFAGLKDGSYSCTAVFVNADGKYEVLTDQAGNRMYADATISHGSLVSLKADKAMPSAHLASLTIKPKGNSHFTATDDPALHSYSAMACDLAS
ncbi:hypothetical protein JD292_03385 [Leucobacter sp. CSA2]|uniref:Uncharacterized protein n=1 Tax=Leucobacter edaphi TaxID=2796472 RepID=A0A934QBI8_9MICO|nr:hypothetical protein [Leucobacter edaphi]MBK0421123.1 hypothetical protein [Leucobacter edaphi]